MKIPVHPNLTVAQAERMADGLGCDLIGEDGRVYLVRREAINHQKEKEHERQTHA